jgi:chromosome segregation protein
VRLRSLTVQGFKSFLQRTTFEFDAGITAIVGPNGSGKSNLADAFRWTMGEQSLRLLRGRRAEDVLFAGGRGRPPAGFAEVTLIFDAASPNGHSALALPFAEVSVARRAYRSGENEYFLNRERARLRDVADFFSQTGLDLDGFAVVSQGAVDLALSLRPSNRRALVEQAAGTGYLQSRLAESRAKLAATRQNLTRVNDLIAELGPRLRSLERQAKQAREREAVQREAWSLALRWFGHLLVAPLLSRYEAATTLAAATEAARSAAVALDDHRSTQHGLEQALGEAEQATALAQDQRGRARDEAGRLSRELSLAEGRRAPVIRRRDELASRIGEARHSLAGEQANLVRFEQQRTDLAARLAELEADAAEQEASYHSLLATSREIEARWVASSHRLANADGALAAARVKLQALDERQSQIGRAIDRHSAKRDALERDRDAGNEQLDDHRRAVVTLDQRHTTLQRQLGEATREVEHVRKECAGGQAEVFRLERKQQTLRARVEALDAIEASGVGYFPGVQAILQAVRSGALGSQTGVHGVVSQLIEIEPRLELAIGVALGARSQDVVVERWTDAERAIAWLKARNLGRATFLPLDTIHFPRPNPKPLAAGVIGVAASLIRIDECHRPIAELLLGQTLVVDDLAIARQLIGRLSGGWQVVTIGGEVARTSGAVTGGAPPTSHGVMIRQRELREVKQALADLTTRLDAAARVADQWQVELDRRAEQLAALRRQATTTEEALRRATADLMDAERRWQHLLERVSSEEQEAAQALADAEALGRDRADLVAALEDCQSEWEIATAALGQVEAEQLLHASDAHDAADALRQRVVERDQLRLRVSGLESELVRSRTRHDTLEEQLCGYGRQSAALGDELVELDQQLVRDRASLAWAEERTHEVERELDVLRQTLTSKRSERDEAATRRAELEARLAHARDGASGAQQMVAAAELELRGIQQQVALELGPVEDLDASTRHLVVLMPDGCPRRQPLERLNDPTKVRDRLAVLRSRLRSLPAGIDAIAEYDAVRERVESLLTQSADLGRTATTLNDAISEIEELMRSRFAATFDAVNAHFSQRFADLFGGGAAHLDVETDGEELGVEVFAQPPGKRTQGLATLSGGERALTAAALLFSLIEANPPPFCVLDEVDAALDEVNVLRFAGCLRELSSRTQFVIITHNRRTMEAASTIYGLTLQDQCETRLLSLQLPTETAIARAASP